MRDMFARMGIWGELLSFLWRRKLYWLLPMILVFSIVAGFLLLSAIPVIGPFMYSLR